MLRLNKKSTALLQDDQFSFKHEISQFILTVLDPDPESEILMTSNKDPDQRSKIKLIYTDPNLVH